MKLLNDIIELIKLSVGIDSNVNRLPKPRMLTDSEAEMLADYFHNKTYCPDSDGFVGTYILPKEVMDIYTKRYSKERGW